MTAPFTLPDSLVQLPADPQEVCRLAEAFLAAWGIDVPGPWPVATDRLDEAQARLGVPLPYALRWFGERFSRHHPVVGHQDALQRAENLTVEDGAVVVRWENQHCASWAVRTTDLGLPDPPVVWRSVGDAGVDAWRPYHDRLSVDLLEWMLGEVLLCLGDRTANLKLDWLP